MWCLDVRVRKEIVQTMEVVWSILLRHLLKCASVLEPGMDFDAKRVKNFRALETSHVSISDIKNERKKLGKNVRTRSERQPNG